MNEKEARAILEEPISSKIQSSHTIQEICEASGYIEAIEKAKVLEKVLIKLDHQACQFCYNAPEEGVDPMLVTVCACNHQRIMDALAKWEKEK